MNTLCYAAVGIVVGLALLGAVMGPVKNDELAGHTLRATAILLPDYSWHVAADAGVAVNKNGFCFEEPMGGHLVKTCAPLESLLAWRFAP